MPEKNQSGPWTLGDSLHEIVSPAHQHALQVSEQPGMVPLEGSHISSRYSTA